MYCPQCGQQQVSDAIRFCSKCGFLLEGVTVVLASGGMLPARYVQPGNQQLSPRSKGVRQGAMLMLSTLLLVPLVSIITVNFLGNPEVIIPITAIFCFVGGLLRILYAVLMEDAVAQMDTNQMGAYTQPAVPHIAHSARNAA
ncbi:MAG: zinc ribbon domain-containing protein, partial [Acidobacteriota bacterium]|nr:zinc ribbon domain-containing protein [Acidobacteriota bacterium]